MPLYRSFRPPLPVPAAGQYFFALSQSSTSTSNTMGNGTLRLGPVIIESPLRIDRIGAELTVAGEAGSVLRLAVFADNGNAYPGSLILDAGTIDGTSATTQVITISTLSLAPGLYWMGGAVQSAATTQPTVRTASNPTIPFGVPLGSSLPGAATAGMGFSQASVTGAIGASFTATVTGTGTVPRMLLRAA